MEMSSRKKVMELAQRIGAKVVVSRAGDHLEVSIEAPRNHFWSDNDVHLLIESKHWRLPIETLWQRLLERMEAGTTPCTNHGPEYGQCEWWK